MFSSKVVPMDDVIKLLGGDTVSTTEGLLSLSYYIYLNKAIYCSVCQYLLTAKEASTHWKTHDPEQAQGNSKKFCQALLGHLKNSGIVNTKDEFVATLEQDLDKRKPLAGFDVTENGAQCPICLGAYKDNNMAYIHCNLLEKSGGHRTEAKVRGIKAGYPFKTCSYQNIWRINHKRIVVNKHLGDPAKFSQNSRCLPLPHEFSQIPWLSQPDVSNDGSDAVGVEERKQKDLFCMLGFPSRLRGLRHGLLLESVGKVTGEEHLQGYAWLDKVAYQYLQVTAKETISLRQTHPKYMKDIQASANDEGLWRPRFKELTADSSFKGYRSMLTKLLRFALRHVQLTRKTDAVLTKTQQKTAKVLLQELLVLQEMTTLDDEIGHKEDYLNDSEDDSEYDEDEDDSEFDEDEDDEGDDNSSISEAGEYAALDSGVDTSTVEDDIMNVDEEGVPSEDRVILPDSVFNAVHNLIQAIFCLDTPNDPFDLKHLLPTFLIIASFDIEGQTFRPPKNITSPIARLKYSIKACMAHNLYMLTQNGAVDLKVFNSHLYWIKEGNKTPFNWLSLTQRKLSTFVYQNPGLPSVTWFEERTPNCYLTYQGKAKIRMSQLQRFFFSLIDKAEEALDRLTQGFIPTGLSVNDLSDDLRNDIQNYSCFHKFFEKTTGPIPAEEYYKYIIQKLSLETNGKPNTSAISKYLSDAKDFIIALFFAIYFTSGMLPRGRDLVFKIIRNTKTMNRNLFWYQKDFVITGGNCKTTSKTGGDSAAIRVLTPKVSKLLFIYQLYVLQTVSTLTGSIKYHRLDKMKKDKLANMYYTQLFVLDGKALEVNKITPKLRKLSATWFDYPKLGFSAWRQILTAVARQVLHNLPLDYSLMDIQFDHSPETGHKHYGVLENSFAHVAQHKADSQIQLAREWQIFWGLRASNPHDIPHSFAGLIAYQIQNMVRKGGSRIKLDPRLAETRPQYPWHQ